jgi:hypothetical protein
LTFNLVILIISETFEKKEGLMKKVLLLLVVILIALPLSARSKLEFSPRGTLYINGGVNFGIGGDIILNPKKNIGLRANLVELIFGDNTIFSLNMVNFASLTTFDILYYTDIAGLFQYVDITFGLLSSGGTVLAFGGGVGMERRVGKGINMFLEPDILILTGGGNSDFMFKGKFGLKMGL